jgi:hypothetical protein
MPALTVGSITLREAKKLCPSYVARFDGGELKKEFIPYHLTLKRGMLVMVGERDYSKRGAKATFKIVKVTSVGVDGSGETNSKIRVADDTGSWRVDNLCILPK